MLKRKLSNIADVNEDIKTRSDTDELLFYWKDYGLPNPYKVVKDFIKEKGLKLYGGQALHEHIYKKDKKGLYSKHEFPDYDVFSPDAWNHAKELADRLNQMGYHFVEAKSSILNDVHHQTYKVGVDLFPMLDLTQVGCEPDKLDSGCKGCSVKGKNNKCISIFNEIPALNMNEQSEKIYTETYDYDTGASKFPKKFFVTSPDWLKVSMYREVTEPLGNPQRLPKVGTRLKKFNKMFETKFKANCDATKKVSIPDKVQLALDEITELMKQKSKNSIDNGISAINFYLKDIKLQEINQSYYVINDSMIETLIIPGLEKKFKGIKLSVAERKLHWKQHFDEERCIYMKNNNKKYLLVTFIEIPKCVPYIASGGKRYAVSDNIIYNLYYKRELMVPFARSEHIFYDIDCVLQEIVKNQKKYKDQPKYARYVSKCFGFEQDPRRESSEGRWIEKMKTVKKTKYYIGEPLEGYITKVYPVPKKDIRLPYRPYEKNIKKIVYKSKKKEKKYSKSELDDIKMS